jgi:hypothetical protein
MSNTGQICSSADEMLVSHLIGIVKDRVNVLTSMLAMDTTAQSSHLAEPVRIHLEQPVNPKRMRSADGAS